MNFLKGTIFVFFLIFFINFAQGLSCPNFGPGLIGEVVYIDDLNDSFRVSLSNLSVLQRYDFFVGSYPNVRFWLLDNYESQARNFFLERDSFNSVDDYYISLKQQDDGGLLRHYDDADWYTSLYGSENFSDYPFFVVSNKLIIEKGDFLIRGFPGHICSYGFIGVFSSSGDLKYVYSIGQFPAFRYKGVDIISSGEQRRDGVLVSYDVDGETFSLFPFQSYNVKNELISSVLVLNAVVPSKGEPELWGTNDYVEQIISFSEPLHLEEIVESRGFFYNIWIWLKGLFSF